MTNRNEKTIKERRFAAQEKIYGLVICNNRVILRKTKRQSFKDGLYYEEQNKEEAAYMHILALLLLFVIGSIVAACDGDFSGLAAIGKFVGGAVLIFAMLWLFTQPALLIIVIVVLVVIAICCSGSSEQS